MDVIVIDFEWNHAMPGRTPVRDLGNEIIQIGAAKIDMQCNVTCTFSTFVKPCYYPKITRDITELTLISDKDVADAPPFLTAVDEFRRWCGDDAVFVSWSGTDISVLIKNCQKIGYPTDWIPDCFDAQLMFDDMEMQEDRTWPLNYALFHFKERPDGAHNALSDVMSTILILKHLDLEDGLSDPYFKVQSDSD